MIKYLSKVACCLSVSFLVFSGISYAQQAAPKTIISGTLKVAVYNDFAPFAEKGAGLDVDIAAALAKKMALQLSVLPFNAGDDVGDDLRNMVWKGHYLGYGPADVMMHVPVDASLANRNDKVTIFAPYLRESVRVVRDGDLVLAQATTSETRYGPKRGKLLEVIGREDEPRSASLLAIYAHGIPTGSDLEYVDAATVQRAVEGRSEL